MVATRLQDPTPRQVNLARLISLMESGKRRFDSWADLMREAGYSESTLAKFGKQIRERIGVQRALAEQSDIRLDKSRGWSKIARDIPEKLHNKLDVMTPGELTMAGKVAVDAAKLEPEAQAEADRIEATDAEQRYYRRVLRLLTAATQPRHRMMVARAIKCISHRLNSVQTV